MYREILVMHQCDKKVFIRNLIAEVNYIKMAVFCGQKWWGIKLNQEYYYVHYITVQLFNANSVDLDIICCDIVVYIYLMIIAHVL